MGHQENAIQQAEPGPTAGRSKPKSLLATSDQCIYKNHLPSSWCWLVHHKFQSSFHLHC